MKIALLTKRELQQPVCITLETVEELEWLHAAVTGSTSATVIAEGSPQHAFYEQLSAELGEQFSRYQERVVAAGEADA